jgi:hypothetical protein
MANDPNTQHPTLTTVASIGLGMQGSAAAE